MALSTFFFFFLPDLSVPLGYVKQEYEVMFLNTPPLEFYIGCFSTGIKTERRNIPVKENGGRVREAAKWRVDCFSKSANLELCSRINSSCQNATLTEFRVPAEFAKYPSQKDVSRRGRRHPLPYAQHSQYSGRAVGSFWNVGV